MVILPFHQLMALDSSDPEKRDYLFFYRIPFLLLHTEASMQTPKPHEQYGGVFSEDAVYLCVRQKGGKLLESCL